MIRSVFKASHSSPLRDQRQTLANFIEKGIPQPIHAGFVEYNDVFTEVTEPCRRLTIYTSTDGWNIPEAYECLREIIDKVVCYEASVNPSFESYNVYLSVFPDVISQNNSDLSPTWFVPHIEKNFHHLDTGRMYMVSNTYGPVFTPITVAFAQYLVQYSVNNESPSLEGSGNTLTQHRSIFVTEPSQIYVFNPTYIVRDRTNYYEMPIDRTMIIIDIEP